MRTETTGKHTRVIFDSFADLVDWCEANDHRSPLMSGRAAFHGGVSTLTELHAIARTGMPREGIEALALSEIDGRDADVKSQQFQSFYSVDGSDVDVARFLSGEPENMVNYYLDDTSRPQRVVTLVVGLGVSGCTPVETIKRRGQKLVALAEAIDSSGLQSEIWAEFTTGYPGKGYSGRVQVRLKGAGELFDAGMFMFALTHAGFYRGYLFNACHAFPSTWISALNIGDGYGRCVYEYVHAEDYPEGSIYLPIIDHDADVDRQFHDTLAELGLVTV